LVLVLVFGALSIAALTVSVIRKSTDANAQLIWVNTNESESQEIATLHVADERISDLMARIGQIESVQQRMEVSIDGDRDKAKTKADAVDKQLKRLEKKIDNHGVEIVGLKEEVQKLTKMANQIYKALFGKTAGRLQFSWTVIMVALGFAWLGKRYQP
jgi:hypothetical protein